MSIKKRGYYPRGDGIVNIEVFPSKGLKPINLYKRKTKNVKMFCSFSKISKDSILTALKKIEEPLEKKGFVVNSEIKEENAIDQGSSVLLFSIDSDSIIGLDGLFDQKTGNYPENTCDFVDYDLSADHHLSDMLVLPACLTKEISVFTVKKITKHLETNLYVASKIAGCKYGISRLDSGFEVRIKGNSDSRI
ncbi:MAG: RNA-3'-phosphate cyclase [Nitrosopumilales archaeon]|nr:MAG: RNA-3'-phosphate cyclase [Nitrosopumilales archaeon]